MPTSPSICPAEIKGFLFALVDELYNEGATVDMAFQHAWLTNERCRQHTDFLLLRPSLPPYAYIWSPRSRPLGISLPSIKKYCHCLDSRWRFTHSTGWNSGDSRHNFRCSGCKYKLTCRVLWDHPYESFNYAGTAFIQCQWPYTAPQAVFLTHDAEADMDISDN